MYYRTERLNSIIRRELGNLIVEKLSDSRLSKLTCINEVKIAKDLSVANVYVAVLGDKEAIEANTAILNDNAKFLRHLLAASVNLRRTPELKFHADTLALEAEHLSQVIKKATKQSQE